MTSGKVVKWTKERGFGFARPDDGGSDVFIHIAELTTPADARRLRVGQDVTFTREEGERGPKGTGVSIGRPAPPAAADDGMCDVLTSTDYVRELDLVLDKVLGSAKEQIKSELAQRGQTHGWVDG